MRFVEKYFRHCFETSDIVGRDDGLPTYDVKETMLTACCTNGTCDARHFVRVVIGIFLAERGDVDDWNLHVHRPSIIYVLYLCVRCFNMCVCVSLKVCICTGIAIFIDIVYTIDDSIADKR